jgi:ATP-dependent RNA helicase DDX10/DBP4
VTRADTSFFHIQVLGFADEGGPVLAGATLEKDDGYVSPEFDLPSESEEEEAQPRSSFQGHLPNKKRRLEAGDDMDEDEELALRLLRQRR